MARFIPDINTKRWVIIAPQRADRPQQANKNRIDEDPYSAVKKEGYNFHQNCPFCLGNEHLTPPEIYRWEGSWPADRKWLVRIVPNKYPIADIHEVIIHSPDHIKDISELGKEHVEILLKVYRQRYQALYKKGSVIIFNNKGKEAGESLVHPHSQVVVIPKQITLDSLILEPVRNVVFENNLFVTFCPDFSQWPYEIWITKKECYQNFHQNNCFFGEITDIQIGFLAEALQKALQILCQKFVHLSYNFYIYPHACWYLRIIPRLTNRAGFELGTGLSVNIVDPACAADELKKQLLKSEKNLKIG